MKSRSIQVSVIVMVILIGWANAAPTAQYLGLGQAQDYFNASFPVNNVKAGELRFDLTDVPGVVDGEIITFCVEVDEFMQAGTYHAVVNTEAVLGGLGGLSPDPLSDETAWVYTDYLANYVGQSAVTAKDYQLAIWYLEEEIANIGDLTADAQTIVANAQAAVLGGWTNSNIRVLNLYEVTGKPVQDVLVQVPAPGALLLSGLGVSLVGWLRRRRQL